MMATRDEEKIKSLVETSSRDALMSAESALGLRGHLGASQIGHRCARQAWYGFRWFHRGQHLGRIMRLFNRGHQEEARLIRWLRSAGYEVQEYAQRLIYNPPTDSYDLWNWERRPDPQCQTEMASEDVSQNAEHFARAKTAGKSPKQWSFTDATGHFSGSSDGRIRGPHLPEGWGGCEFKTMNDKSFRDTLAKGVLTSKPTYWVQMQIYMHMLNLKWCLFVAVNKNDDDIYYEVVYAKEEIALQYHDLAVNIVTSNLPPVRLTQDPSWFECKFCDFREICHRSAAPDRNCRTCIYSETRESGTFYCTHHKGTIPILFQAAGCEKYEAIL